MTWGNWIIVSFVVFALFIGVLVTVCVRQDVNLVSKNYYKEDLAFQGQMDRIRNTASLDIKPLINVNENWVEIHFLQLKDVEKGEVRLFRPSDASMDQQFRFNSPDDSILQYEVKTLQRGLYRAQMTWTMNGKEYYLEKVITI